MKTEQRGKFVSDRAIANAVRRHDQSMCDYGAWHWLLSNAAFKDHVVNFGRTNILVKRGQVPVSIRKLATEFGWSKDRVSRYINALRTRALISTDTRTPFLIITICNYNEIQNIGSDSKDSNKDNNRDRNKDTNKDKQNTITNETNKKNDHPDFQTWYNHYPNKKARQAASKAFSEAIKKDTLEGLIAGVKRYIDNTPKWQNYAYPATWLNEERWKDEYSAPKSASQSTTETENIENQKLMGLIP